MKGMCGMKSEHFEPKGIRYQNLVTDREEMLITEGGWKDWIAYRHPDGQWVSLIKLTPYAAEKLVEKLQSPRRA